MGNLLPEPESVATAAAAIAIYLAVLWLPGGLIAAAAGLRGWLLAAGAPLLSYAAAGLAGPYTALLGLPFNLLTFGACALGLALVLWVFRLVTVRWRGGERERERVWPRQANLAVVACVLIASVVGAIVVLTGLGAFNSIPQDFDAGFHANGIRYIAETGDGGLYGMSKVNWYLLNPGIFYPNAYHLIAALVFKLSGVSIPATMNTATMLTPALLVLSLVAMIRAFRGRAALACYTAFVAVAVTVGVYEGMFRGPLLPYQVGIALTPLIGALVLYYLERPGLDSGALLGLGAIGLLAVHSSALFGAIALLLPMFAQRWWRYARRAGRDFLLILAAALPAMLLALPHLLGALSIRSNVPTMTWPVDFTTWEAIGRLLTLHNSQVVAPWVLAGAMWLGILTFWRLRSLGWVVGSAVLTGAMFVIVASVKEEWVPGFSSPWWNDRWRLISLAALPLCLLAGHGLAQVQQWLGWLLRKLRPIPAPRFAAAGLVLVAFVPATQLLYGEQNVQTVRYGYSHYSYFPPGQMTVSPDEVTAMQKLATMVRPGERVMNDRSDGSLWMYALAGVQPVAGHFDKTLRDGRLTLLTRHFNNYAEDPEVRRIVRELNIGYVMVDTGYVRKNQMFREPGLTHLDDKPFLREVYRNPNATIYRLVPLPSFAHPFPAGPDRG